MNHSLYGFVCALLICAGMSPILSALFGGSNSSIEWLAPTTSDTWTSSSSYYSKPSGSGTAASPYLITEAGELAYFAATGITSDTYLSLSNSIDLSEHTWVPINVSSGVTVTFTGNSYNIEKMVVYDTSLNGGGLFGYVSGTLNASNVNIYNAKVTCNNNAGALVGYMASGTVQYITTGGTIASITSNAGGVAGYCGGTIKGSTNYASISCAGSGAGGVVGCSDGTVSVCFDYGIVTGSQKTGGIAGISTGVVKSCLVYDTSIICKKYSGGIVGYSSGEINSSGFNGNIVVEGSLATYVGVMAGYSVEITDSFGVGSILIKDSNTVTGVNQSGGLNGTDFTSCYAFTSIVTTSASTSTQIRYYCLGDSEDEADAFSNFYYSDYVNGGYPYPSGLIASGAFSTSGVLTYLQGYGFDAYETVYSDGEIFIDADYGRYYIYFGSYPQSYVGDEMNETLENWYSSTTYTDQYTFTLTTSLTTTIYYSYTYTDGESYVRVPSANPYTTGYTFNDETGTTITSGTTYWFKVEPIKWLVLNPETYDDDGYYYIVANDALMANIPWSTSSSYTLWSSSYCKIRTWLNSFFFYDAFSDDEQTSINTNVTIANNSTSSTTDGSGTSTTDSIWLLSYTEVTSTYSGILYISGGSASDYDLFRRCSPSDFALANNAVHTTSYITIENYGSCTWWLRSAYSTSSNLRRVDYFGNATYAYSTNLDICIRPALQIAI